MVLTLVVRNPESKGRVRANFWGVTGVSKLGLLVPLAAMAAVVAPVAGQAAQSITFAPSGPDGSISGVFSDNGIASGSFVDVFNFTFPQNGVAGATISSIFVSSQANNVNFTSVTLNGTEFAVNLTGNVEFRSLLATVVSGGQQVLRVAGNSGGNASYAGTISFAPTGAVPEPATWAMLILGFGIAGFAMRSAKRRSNVKIGRVTYGAAA